MAGWMNFGHKNTDRYKDTQTDIYTESPIKDSTCGGVKIPKLILTSLSLASRSDTEMYVFSLCFSVKKKIFHTS